LKTAVFVTIWALGTPSEDFSNHMRGDPLEYLKSVPGVETVELYVPQSGDVPKMDDIPAPTIIVQVDFDSQDDAKRLLDSDKFKALFLDSDAFPVPAEKINLEAFETVHYPLQSEEMPPERTAPMSFVVRYYGPVKDHAQFVKTYTEMHPPLLAKFPAIRNVLCYLPLGWADNSEISDDAIVIGNEVVFDDLAGLNAALASPASDAVMTDSENFPSWGYSSHHAMHRELIYAR
jgi:uncharacterized protein (TIGR02118 family)